MSDMEAVNQIVADLSGTDGEKAEFILSQRNVFGLNQTEWRSLLLRLSSSLRQELGVQMRQGGQSSAAGSVPSDMNRFRSLLANPEQKVLIRCLLNYAPAVQACTNQEEASALYDKVFLLPNTSTELIVQKESGIFLNGDFQPNVPSKSQLLHGYRDCRKPVLVKFCRDHKSALLELEAFQDLPDYAAHHLVGPMEALAVKGHIQDHAKVGLGIVMPVYPGTLQHVPVPILDDAAIAVIDQVTVALDYVHKRGWGHSDVKPPNIFITPDGNFDLGDFGAMRKLGKDAGKKTAQFVPSDAPFSVDHASKHLDKSLLAVTVLQKLGLLKLKGRSGPSYAAIQEAVAKIENQALRFRLEGLVLAA